MISTYPEALAYLDRHIGAGVKPGLERIRLLVEAMGSPHLGVPTIHVAGTNGKTSTTRLSALLLVAHGLSTGTYTSPHLERIEERLGINGRIATPDELVQAVADVAAFAEILEDRGDAHFTYFELTTAMAFAFFADQAVEATVIEVGLGGRLDATNVVEADVAVLTGVSLEHTEYLGPTVEAIAAEKLAIAGPDSILVTGPLEPAVFDLAEKRARELGIQHRAYGRDFSVDATRAVKGWQIDIQGAEDDYPGLHLPVHGRHQTLNAAISVAAVEALLGRKLDPEAVAEATGVFDTPGRMEPVAGEPFVLLDGAHNEGGFATLEDALDEEFPTTRWVLVLGVMGDKDLEGMIARIASRVDAVITTTVPEERALPAAQIAARVAPLVTVPVEPIGNPETALEVARQRAGADGSVLVTGSLYLVGVVRQAALSDGGG
ncbi:MAG TPA: folylpolyglutamate synthase/dihydrofolate synthase family protein [Acidimicrobiia bacterium]|nr:folylpolyglutamate synthase/dihydrofolate synthase family protein [Acidimicrobiia bacterium]